MKLAIVAAKSEILSAQIRLLSSIKHPDCSIEIFFVDDKDNVSELSSLLKDLSVSDTVLFAYDASRKSIFVRLFAQYIPALHWCQEYFIPPSALSKQLSDCGLVPDSSKEILGNSLYAFLNNERAVISARDDLGRGTKDIGLLAPVLALKEQVVASNLGSPCDRGQLAIATCANANIEYRTQVLLRVLEQKSIASKLYWMCESKEEESIKLLLKEYPSCELEIVSGRKIKNWTYCLEHSDFAFHCSESPYDCYYYYLLVSLSLGCPVVLTKFATQLEIPLEVSWGVEPGCEESKQLDEVVDKIINADSEVSRRVSLAKSYIEINCSPTMILDELASVAKVTLSGKNTILGKDLNIIDPKLIKDIKEVQRIIG